MLLLSNKYIWIRRSTRNVDLEIKNNIYEHTGFTTNNNENIGIFLHTDC